MPKIKTKWFVWLPALGVAVRGGEHSKKRNQRFMSCHTGKRETIQEKLPASPILSYFPYFGDIEENTGCETQQLISVRLPIEK